MNAENILMYTSGAVLVLVAVATLVYRGWILRHAFAKDKLEYFDKTQLPKYITILIISAVILTVYAVVLTRNLTLILQFVFGNLFFVAVGCMSLILYQRKR